MNASYTIIYITSSGHSGSTLLDMLISAHGDVTSLGEVKELSRRRDSSKRRQAPRKALEARRCACGEKVLACPFWRQIDEHLAGHHELTLQELELDHADLEQFLRHNRALFEAARDVSGSRYLVDLSKDPIRLDRLVRAGFDVRPIHLVRSPYGVVYSEMKKNRQWTRNAAIYTYLWFQIRRVLADRAFYPVRYEELTESPANTLSGIMEWFGLSFDESQLDWASHPRHHLAGNRVRYGKSPGIEIDLEWRTRLSRYQKLGIFLLTLPTRWSSMPDQRARGGR